MQEVSFLKVIFEEREGLYLRIRNFQRSWLRVDLIYAIIWSFFCPIILFIQAWEFKVTDQAIAYATFKFFQKYSSTFPTIIAKLRLFLVLVSLIILSCPYRTILARLIWRDHYSFWFTRTGHALKWSFFCLFLAWCWFAEVPIYQKQLLQIFIEESKVKSDMFLFPVFAVHLAILWTLFIQLAETITRQIMKKRCANIQPEQWLKKDLGQA